MILGKRADGEHAYAPSIAMTLSRNVSLMSCIEPPRVSFRARRAFQALPKLTVKFGEQLIRVYGDTAVNTGYYTLSYTKDGETKSIPARYSFTYVKDGNDCKIVDHHSSAMPAPTR
jgi:hypothetical protein